ncbi:MAG: hypothetical protein GY739_07620 [Mesoflavibacter sp.]|nr:hypothetical protein [Mesoflavibacter sp.]
MDKSKKTNSKIDDIKGNEQQLSIYIKSLETEKNILIDELNKFIKIDKNWNFCSRKGAIMNLRKSIERIIDWQHESLVLFDLTNEEK